MYVHVYIYRYQVTLSVTLNNVTPLNNLLLNSYFENPIGCNLQFNP